MFWHILIALIRPVPLATLRRELLGEIAHALRLEGKLPEALEGASQEHPSFVLRIALRKIVRLLEEGNDLAESFDRLRPLATQEQTAILSSALKTLSPAPLLDQARETLHQRDLQSEKIRWALYPALIVTLLALAALLVLSSGPVPALASLGSRSMPWIFQWASQATENLTTLAFFLLLIGAGFLCFSAILSTRFTRYLPIIAPFNRASTLALVSRSVAGLLEAGLPLVEAVKSGAAILPQGRERIEMLEGVQRLASGEPVSLAFDDNGFISPFFKLGVQAPQGRDAAVKGLQRVAELFEAELVRLGERLLLIAEIGGILFAGAVTAAITIATWHFYFGTLSSYNF